MYHNKHAISVSDPDGQALVYCWPIYPAKDQKLLGQPAVKGVRHVADIGCHHGCHIDGKIRSFSVRKKGPLAAKCCPRSLMALKGHPSTWAAVGR